MGRNAAGESFLRAYLAHSQQSHLTIQVDESAHAIPFQKALEGLRPGVSLSVITSDSLPALSNVDAIFHPGPGLSNHARQRSLFGNSLWSLCGITHTTSSSGAMDSICGMLHAPVQEWDGLICTSTAVKENVVRLLQGQLDEIALRFGATKFVLPQMPVIPLGVHESDFSFTAEDRARARSQLEIEADEIVVLYMGRLSFHAKAHPLAMYQALELAARRTDTRPRLIECGWFANDFIETSFKEAAAVFSPSVKVTHLDGRVQNNKRIAWACADIFCSLSDNIQETFGITPIEAMATGLPSVVSDWNGYKDTVRQGLDGFRVKTTQPPNGLGGDLSVAHALGIDSYDRYCGYTSSLVAVDVGEAAKAFETLIRSPHLRREFGQNARQRARDTFEWRTIIPQYETFWSELKARRPKESTKGWPARPDPFWAFAHYATHILQPEHAVALVDGSEQEAQQKLNTLLKLEMVKFAAKVIPQQSELLQVLTSLANGPSTVAALLSQFEATRQPYIHRGLCWMLKMNLLTRQT